MTLTTLSRLTTWRTYLQGMLIGVADLVPGVSGGTIALLLGIYPRLLHLITQLKALRHLQTWRQLPQHLMWRFSLPLLGGVLTSMLLFARLVHWLYDQHQGALKAFFIGLILGSVVHLMRPLLRNFPSTNTQGIALVVLFLLGLTLAWGLVQLPLYSGNPTNLGVFLSGLLACATMILPGVSGSFMLLLLGQYDYILQALVHWNWGVLIFFALGGVLGLLGMAQLLRTLLDRYQAPTMACLIGMLLGGVPALLPLGASLHLAYLLGLGGLGLALSFLLGATKVN